MKQFLIYVLATIVGIFITMMVATVGMFLMSLMMMFAGMASPAPKVPSHSILHISLDGPVEERVQGRSLMDEIQGMGDNAIALNDIIKSIDNAASDSKIEGIYLDCMGGGGGAATMAYLRDALERFKDSGKWIVAYGDAYTQSNYYLASVADSVWLNPQGVVDIHGLGGTLPFYKGLLDKLGVEMQVIKVGTYKSAVEPYILTAPSEANKEQIKGYITPIWNYFCEGIGTSRGVGSEAVNQWADSLLMTRSQEYLLRDGVVTSLLYRHEAEDWMKEQTGKTGKDDRLGLVPVSKYVKTIKPKKSSNNIAVLYAVGDIVDRGNEGIVGEKMAPLILDLAEDDDVDALVLRVNSGGGSAFASEQIWEALEQFKATGKTFYVSMGDVAASGGYYISCGADRIYCQPVTITGSIGIFGLIPSIKGLLTDKLGVNVATVATNPEANIGIIDPMTPLQRASMQAMIDRGYETFVGRCAAGRDLPVDSIKAIAEGRVWDGQTALRIGLVDQLGDLDRCIADLAEECGFDDYKITEYPEPRGEWWEEILLSSTTIKERIIKSELGDAYPYYNMMKKMERLEHVQCRMEEVVIE